LVRVRVPLSNVAVGDDPRNAMNQSSWYLTRPTMLESWSAARSSKHPIASREYLGSLESGVLSTFPASV
jgi:hypothetical protein